MRHFNFSDVLPGSYELYLPGDTHMGNASFKRNLFHKFVRLVLSKKNSRVAFGGDLVDAISIMDKRYNLDSVDPAKVRISAQRDAAKLELEPIANAGKFLYALDGNHEFKLNHIMNIVEEVMGLLDVTYDFGKDGGGVLPAYGTYMAVSDLGALRLFDWHGWGSSNSRAGDSHQREMNEQIFVKRKMRDLYSGAEAMCMHHIHKMRIHPPSNPLLITSTKKGRLKASYGQPAKITLNPKKPDDRYNYYVPEEHRWYASSGSFLGGLAEGYSPYSERFGYAPTDIGCVKLIVKNDKFRGFKKVIFND